MPSFTRWNRSRRTSSASPPTTVLAVIGVAARAAPRLGGLSLRNALQHAPSSRPSASRKPPVVVTLATVKWVTSAASAGRNRHRNSPPKRRTNRVEAIGITDPTDGDENASHTRRSDPDYYQGRPGPVAAANRPNVQQPPSEPSAIPTGSAGPAPSRCRSTIRGGRWTTPSAARLCSPAPSPLAGPASPPVRSLARHPVETTGLVRRR